MYVLRRVLRSCSRKLINSGLVDVILKLLTNSRYILSRLVTEMLSHFSMHHSSVCYYFLSEFLSQRPMIARFFYRAELVVSSQSPGLVLCIVYSVSLPGPATALLLRPVSSAWARLVPSAASFVNSFNIQICLLMLVRALMPEGDLDRGK